MLFANINLRESLYIYLIFMINGHSVIFKNYSFWNASPKIFVSLLTKN